MRVWGALAAFCVRWRAPARNYSIALRERQRLQLACRRLELQGAMLFYVDASLRLRKAFDSEHALKAKVIQRLRESKRFGSHPIIATEYRVGSTGVRADLVVASRSTREVVAIEIKSAVDSLKRLPSQLDAYTRYFDRVILVAAHRHQRHVRQLTFPGLELWEVEKSGALATVRLGGSSTRKESPADLLTQRERLRYRGLIESGHDGAKDAFFAVLEDRHGEISDLFWRGVSGKVNVDCLATLSRFEAERVEARQRQAAESERLSSWQSSVAAA